MNKSEKSRRLPIYKVEVVREDGEVVDDIDMPNKCIIAKYLFHFYFHSDKSSISHRFQVTLHMEVSHKVGVARETHFEIFAFETGFWGLWGNAVKINSYSFGCNKMKAHRSSHHSCKSVHVFGLCVCVREKGR
jgi:hypothetical protein